MAELLSAGVFIEEVPSQVQAIQAVSTSNLGAVGFTTKGPVNEPTLVTSFDVQASRCRNIEIYDLRKQNRQANFWNDQREEG